MSKLWERRWAELAPFRESVLVHFTRPGLRRRLQEVCEEIAEEALELEQGTDFGEPWVKAGARAVLADLWHSQQVAHALASTPFFSKVTEAEVLLCRYLESLAAQLEGQIADLDRQLGPPPPDLPTDAARRPTN